MGGLLSKFRKDRGEGGSAPASRDGTLDRRQGEGEGAGAATGEAQETSGSRDGTLDRKKKGGTSSREGTLDRKKKGGTSSREGTLDRKNKEGGASRGGTLTRFFKRGDGGDGGKSATLKSQKGHESGDEAEKSHETSTNPLSKLFRRSSKDKKKDRKTAKEEAKVKDAQDAGFEVIGKDEAQQAAAGVEVEVDNKDASAQLDLPGSVDVAGSAEVKVDAGGELNSMPPRVPDAGEGEGEKKEAGAGFSLDFAAPKVEAKVEVAGEASEKGRRKPFLVPKTYLKPYRSREDITDDKTKTSSKDDLTASVGGVAETAVAVEAPSLEASVAAPSLEASVAAPSLEASVAAPDVSLHIEEEVLTAKTAAVAETMPDVGQVNVDLDGGAQTGLFIDESAMGQVVPDVGVQVDADADVKSPELLESYAAKMAADVTLEAGGEASLETQKAEDMTRALDDLLDEADRKAEAQREEALRLQEQINELAAAKAEVGADAGVTLDDSRPEAGLRICPPRGQVDFPVPSLPAVAVEEGGQAEVSLPDVNAGFAIDSSVETAVLESQAKVQVPAAADLSLEASVPEVPAAADLSLEASVPEVPAAADLSLEASVPEVPAAADLSLEASVPEAPAAADLSLEASLPEVPAAADLSLEASVPEVPAAADLSLEASLPEVPAAADLSLEASLPEVPAAADLSLGASLPEVPAAADLSLEASVPEVPAAADLSLEASLPEVPAAADLSLEASVPDVPVPQGQFEAEAGFQAEEPSFPQVPAFDVGAGVDASLGLDTQMETQTIEEPAMEPLSSGAGLFAGVPAVDVAAEAQAPQMKVDVEMDPISTEDEDLVESAGVREELGGEIGARLQAAEMPSLEVEAGAGAQADLTASGEAEMPALDIAAEAAAAAEVPLVDVAATADLEKGWEVLEPPAPEPEAAFVTPESPEEIRLEAEQPMVMNGKAEDWFPELRGEIAAEQPSVDLELEGAVTGGAEVSVETPADVAPGVEQELETMQGNLPAAGAVEITTDADEVATSCAVDAASVEVKAEVDSPVCPEVVVTSEELVNEQTPIEAEPVVAQVAAEEESQVPQELLQQDAVESQQVDASSPVHVSGEDVQPPEQQTVEQSIDAEAQEPTEVPQQEAAPVDTSCDVSQEAVDAAAVAPSEQKELESGAIPQEAEAPSEEQPKEPCEVEKAATTPAAEGEAVQASQEATEPQLDAPQESSVEQPQEATAGKSPEQVPVSEVQDVPDVAADVSQSVEQAVSQERSAEPVSSEQNVADQPGETSAVDGSGQSIEAVPQEPVPSEDVVVDVSDKAAAETVAVEGAQVESQEISSTLEPQSDVVSDHNDNSMEQQQQQQQEQQQAESAPATEVEQSQIPPEAVQASQPEASALTDTPADAAQQSVDSPAEKPSEEPAEAQRTEEAAATDAVVQSAEGQEKQAAVEQLPAETTTQQQESSPAAVQPAGQTQPPPGATSQQQESVLAPESPVSRVATSFVWEHGGNAVNICGTFTDWVEVPLASSGEAFKVTLEIPKGKHYYRYNVDGDTMANPMEAMEEDLNVVEV